MISPRQALGALFVVPFLAFSLSGCVSDTDTPPPTTTAPSAPTVALPADDATAVGEATTLGALADRITAGWPAATTISWRYTTIAVDYTAAGSATSADPIPGFTFFYEVDADGNRRMSILSGSIVAGQLVAVDGAVWAWGLLPIPPAAISAGDDAGWVAVTPEAALADPQGGQLVTSILAPVAPVFTGMSASDRALVAVPIDPQPFGDRTCPAWRSEDPNGGQPIVTILGIDDAGLVCGVAISHAGQTALTIWTFGGALSIAPPDGTPVPPTF